MNLLNDVKKFDFLPSKEYIANYTFEKKLK